MRGSVIGMARRMNGFRETRKVKSGPVHLGSFGVPHRESSTRLESPTMTATPPSGLSVMSDTE